MGTGKARKHPTVRVGGIEKKAAKAKSAARGIAKNQKMKVKAPPTGDGVLDRLLEAVLNAKDESSWAALDDSVLQDMAKAVAELGDTVPAKLYQILKAAGRLAMHWKEIMRGGIWTFS